MPFGRPTLFAMIFSLFLLNAHMSAADKSKVGDLEKKVGKGWQCFAIPNGLDTVGVILEQRPDKSVFYVDDLKESGAPKSPVAIGSLSTSKSFSVGAAIKLINRFFPSLNVTYNSDQKTNVVISGAEEVAGGKKVSDDAIAWAQKNLSGFRPGSRLFVVREAILASQVNYTFDTTIATAIGSQLDLGQGKSATANGTSDGKSTTASGASDSNSPSNGTPSPKPVSSTDVNVSVKQSSTVSQAPTSNQITQTFDPKIAVCIHPDQIILGNSYGGDLKVSLKPVVDDLDFR